MQLDVHQFNHISKLMPWKAWKLGLWVSYIIRRCTRFANEWKVFNQNTEIEWLKKWGRMQKNRMYASDLPTNGMYSTHLNTFRILVLSSRGEDFNSYLVQGTTLPIKVENLMMSQSSPHALWANMPMFICKFPNQFILNSAFTCTYWKNTW